MGVRCLPSSLILVQGLTWLSPPLLFCISGRYQFTQKPTMGVLLVPTLLEDLHVEWTCSSLEDKEAAMVLWWSPSCWPPGSLSHFFHVWGDGKHWEWEAHVVGVLWLSGELRVPPLYPLNLLLKTYWVWSGTAVIGSWVLHRCFEAVTKPSWRIKQRVVFCVVFFLAILASRKVQGDAVCPAPISLRSASLLA